MYNARTIDRPSVCVLRSVTTIASFSLIHDRVACESVVIVNGDEIGRVSRGKVASLSDEDMRACACERRRHARWLFDGSVTTCAAMATAASATSPTF